MRYLIFLISLTSISAFGAPCGGAPGESHRNPDGSLGGFVANTAQISKHASIGLDSVVCDKVKINGRAIIKGKSEILGETEINGNAEIVDSRLYSAPRISGSSVIIRSVVCQASQINSLKVIDSSYYCNVDDPEPHDPGEAGKKDLLGIDSDGDGVRDDVEIYLNRIYSNTEDKENTTELVASKVYFKNISSSIRMRKDDFFQVTKWKERLDILSCNEISKYEDVMPEYLNTKERLMAWIEVSGKSHGEIYENNKINCIDFNNKLGIARKGKK